MRRIGLVTKITTAFVIIAGIVISDAGAKRYMLGSEGEARYERKIVEEQVAGADGNFNGKDSSDESVNKDFVHSGDPKHRFTILEIVPDECVATMGYLVGGSELVRTSTAEMRQASLDAFVNKEPGDGNNQNSSNDNINIINNLKTKLPTTTVHYDWGTGSGNAIDVDKNVECTGYYKYVGSGKGLYRKSSRSGVMESKYFYNGSGFDYIWVSGMPEGNIFAANDVRLSGDKQYRNVFVNRDVFRKELYSAPSGTSAGWKDSCVFNVITRSAPDVRDADVDDADLIIINDGTGSEASEAMNLYNAINKIYQSNHSKGTFFDKSNSRYSDLGSFEIAKRIYDRVAVKKDVAITVSMKKRGNVNKIEGNLDKLMHMLFYVKKDGVTGKGRDMFTDYLNEYVSAGNAVSQETNACSNSFKGLSEKNGYMYQDDPFESEPTETGKIVYYNSADGIWKKAYRDDEGSVVYTGDEVGKNLDFESVDDKTLLYNSKSNTTDYIYIDDDGNLKIKDDNSGKWFNCDFIKVGDGNGGVKDNMQFKKVSWSAKEYEDWPWNVKDECLVEWWFHNDMTDERSDGGDNHIPLFFHYYTKAGVGGHYSVFDGDPSEGNYENQSFAYDNRVFEADFISDAIANRTVTKESTDPSKEIYDNDEPYYISMNIYNGDGVNKNNGAVKNKSLYVNKYELLSPSKQNDIYFDFQVKTSCVVKTIKLKKGGTILKTYSLVSGTEKSTEIQFNNGLKLIADKGDNPTNKEQVTVGEGANSKVIDTYLFKGTIPKGDIDISGYRNNINTEYEVEVEVEPVAGTDRIVSDKIKVIVRDFFGLK